MQIKPNIAVTFNDSHSFYWWLCIKFLPQFGGKFNALLSGYSPRITHIHIHVVLRSLALCLSHQIVNGLELWTCVHVHQFSPCDFSIFFGMGTRFHPHPSIHFIYYYVNNIQRIWIWISSYGSQHFTSISTHTTFLQCFYSIKSVTLPSDMVKVWLLCFLYVDTYNIHYTYRKYKI